MLVQDYAAIDERQLGFDAVGYWAGLPQKEKNTLRHAFGVLQQALAERPEIHTAIHDVIYHGQGVIEEELVQSKRHLPIDVAARTDEYLRGKLDVLGDVASLLTQPSRQNDITKQMEKE